MNGANITTIIETYCSHCIKAGLDWTVDWILDYILDWILNCILDSTPNRELMSRRRKPPRLKPVEGLKQIAMQSATLL